MAIKDSIVNLKKGLRTTLTNVPALIDTLVRGLDGVAEAAEEASTYSTDERIVGTWIDGSEIYEKMIDFGKLPNATDKEVAHNISNLKNIIEVIGTANTSTNHIPLPYIAGTTPNYNYINIFITNTVVRITTNVDRATYDGTIIIRYTKTNTSRSLENANKNNRDEEKNDNER